VRQPKHSYRGPLRGISALQNTSPAAWGVKCAAPARSACCSSQRQATCWFCCGFLEWSHEPAGHPWDGTREPDRQRGRKFGSREKNSVTDPEAVRSPQVGKDFDYPPPLGFRGLDLHSFAFDSTTAIELTRKTRQPQSAHRHRRLAGASITGGGSNPWAPWGPGPPRAFARKKSKFNRENPIRCEAGSPRSTISFRCGARSHERDERLGACRDQEFFARRLASQRVSAARAVQF
jgi:hypothetical protein